MTMAISREEVKRIASLARLALTPAEETLYQKELSLVLAYVSELEKLDVSGVTPMTGGTDLMTVMRDDAVVDAALEGASADLLGVAPEREGDLVKVRSVF